MLNYPETDDWLEHIFDNLTYQELPANEQATVIIISLCSAADELDNLEKGGKDRSQTIALKKSHVRNLYDKFTSIYDLVSSSFIKIWGLQTFLFLRSQQISHSRYIDIPIQDHLDKIFNDVFDIFKFSSNPFNQSIRLNIIIVCHDV